MIAHRLRTVAGGRIGPGGLLRRMRARGMLGITHERTSASSAHREPADAPSYQHLSQLPPVPQRPHFCKSNPADLAEHIRPSRSFMISVVPP